VVGYGYRRSLFCPDRVNSSELLVRFLLFISFRYHYIEFLVKIQEEFLLKIKTVKTHKRKQIRVTESAFFL